MYIKLSFFRNLSKICQSSIVLALILLAVIIPAIITSTPAWGDMSAYRWSNWEPLGGVLKGGPAVSSWGEGRLDVFVTGANNQLFHKWFSNNRWSDDRGGFPAGWEPLYGTETSDPVPVSWGAGRIDVFARGQNSQLWHKYYNHGWSGWTDEGLKGLVTNGGPAATTWGQGRLDLFARGNDNQLYHKWFSNNRWSDNRDGFPAGWEPLGGQLTSDPSAVAWSPNRIDVFAIGPSHDLIHKWWTQKRRFRTPPFVDEEYM